MRLLKSLSYLLIILSLQTVLFARINLFGAVPDLILVSVIIFAILNKPIEATFFALGSGFIQDIFGFALYLNTITKVAFSSLVEILKESFGGGELQQSLFLVGIFSPISILFHAWADYFFYSSHIRIEYLIISIILTTFYNLVLVFPVFFIIERFLHE